MPEYLVLMKLNPGKIFDALNLIRNLEAKPVSGVDLRYSLNIFGSWDVGVWIDAENNSEVVDFVQKRIGNLDGVTEVYTVPTFPHGNQSARAISEKKEGAQQVPLEA